jgi:hypothetical protein
LHNFQWLGLPAGIYKVIEEVNGSTYTFIKPITVIVDDGHRDVLLPIIENRLEGCSPGYWKNHVNLWGDTGVDPQASFNDVFQVDAPFTSSITMEQAINLGGGGNEKLARHGVAALLSALYENIFFPYERDNVVAMVRDGLKNNAEPAASELASANNLTCPLR